MAKFSDGLTTSKTSQSTDKFCNERGIFIEFYHIPSRLTVSFKGFITNFVDNYEVDFDKQEVYGRLDPIAIYKGTSRNIQLSWTLVAETEKEAYENLRKAQQYAQMLYPSYKNFVYGSLGTKKFSASTLSTPPLLKMKFMNLVAKYETSADALVAVDSTLPSTDSLNASQRDLEKRISIKFGADGNAKEDGLLVIPGNITIDPKLSDRGALVKGKTAIPFEIEMSSVYTILHEHDLGFDFSEVLKQDISRLERGVKANVRKLNKASSLPEGNLNQVVGKGTQQSALQFKIEAQKKKISRSKRVLKRFGERNDGDFSVFPYGVKK